MPWPWQLPSNLTFLHRVGHTVGTSLAEVGALPSYLHPELLLSRWADLECDEC